MKKLLIIMLALALVLTFAAGCGNTDKGKTNDTGGTEAVADDESLKGSGDAFSAAAAAAAADTSLDDLNIFDPDDDASFKSGAGWDKDSMVSASADQQD